MSLALVLGGAACVWQDVLAVYRLATPDTVIATNDMIVHWPLPLDYAVTLHPQNLPTWLERRRACGRSERVQVWSYTRAPHVDRITADWRGSSVLLAVKVALVEFKAGGTIIAGAPLDRSRHFARGTAWTDAHTFYPGWTAHKRLFAPQSRSMSGWTKLLLGPPDADWLASINARTPTPELIAAIEAAAS